MTDRARIERYSRFCGDWLQAHPERFRALVDAGVLERPPAIDAAGPRAAVADATSAESFMSTLRQWRNEWMFVIAWRDLVGGAPLEEILAALSDLADAAIEAALAFAARELEERYGEPRDAAGEPRQLIVIGMGKLGGRELNFSSDIDLIFAYRDEAETKGAAPAAEYYKRLARRLVQLLSEPTADGFVFRVDTRLRPFGDAGALVAGLAATENYYQSHGREWERYAWIKARPVAGDLDGGRELIRRLRPFVYRRYLDYSALESIRDMKLLIEKQVARRGLEGNIKLGRGGIREVEFIAQVFQLIRGGHEADLQDNRLMPVLARLGEAGHLPGHAVSELLDAYRFLRRTENRLQMRDDRQTHELPVDEADRCALAESMAESMDCPDWPEFQRRLGRHRRQVHEQFQQVFAAPQVEQDDDRDSRDFLAIWQEEDDSADASPVLERLGFTEPDQAWKKMCDLRRGGLYASLGDRGRRRLAELLPMLLRVAAHTDAPDRALQRSLGVLERIVGRTTYIALLIENPAALSRLVTLCAASSWITRQIEQAPVLLDSLLDSRVLYRAPRRDELERELREGMAALPAADLERRMDYLRRFRQQAMLRVAVADVSNSMPLMIVSDHLTELAEVILDAALAMAWSQMTERYGRPVVDGADGEAAPFLIVGYGKLGGLELGYGSDLDLVFLHRGHDGATTDGARQLSHGVFFMRLAQRIIHLLSTQTGAGVAYEIDTRLRPSGRSGLLVTGLEAFERYQSEKAWTWEHQALVRARPVAGDRDLAAAFGDLRGRVLGWPRDLGPLRREVAEMRERMRKELDRSDRESFDLKQGRGGLIDIEFIAQFAVLRWAHACEELLLFSDTIRILETLESGELMSYRQTRDLTDAYRAYRRDIHAAALQEAPRAAPATAYRDERAAVVEVWQQFFEVQD